MSSIHIEQNGVTRTLSVPADETLLSALRRAGYSIPAACGGKGRCGKCRVPVNGVPRLACRVYPADGDTVTLPESADGAILTRTLPPPACQPGRTGCAAAVDLGTTTVVARLYDLASGAELATESGWSAQAPYGADVISRIQYTLEQPDGLQELSQRSREQVWALIERALVRCGRDADTLREITLVGNTVMQHLFAGYSVRGIAAAPFQPETLFDASETVPLHGVPVHLAPCVAGYVGGDITAGLLAAGLAELPGEHLFLDIGTNGEMALGGRGGFTCCAVASGPAFEGAGISCGMPGVDGAVSRVQYDHGFVYDVIGGGTPKGLCGSGLLDLTAVLLRLGAIAPGGRLLPPEQAPAALRRHLTHDADGQRLLSPDAGGIAHGGGCAQSAARQGRRCGGHPGAAAAARSDARAARRRVPRRRLRQLSRPGKRRGDRDAPTRLCRKTAHTRQHRACRGCRAHARRCAVAAHPRHFPGMQLP